MEKTLKVYGLFYDNPERTLREAVAFQTNLALTPNLKSFLLIRCEWHRPFMLIYG